jgi:serine/threonine protein phosphatase PrpC
MTSGTTEHFRWGTATDPGRIRTENEDDLIAEGQVFGVADGMGGHLAGEIASKMAADRLKDRLAGGADHPDVVVAAVMEANAAIFSAAHANVEQRGMGTTLTALALLHDDGQRPARLAIVNVGDSRTYVMRNGRLRRVTTDHSYVQELVATGHITEQEARNHPRRNIVTRALGIEPLVRVDTIVLPAVRGDRFVLCSDGLVDEVDDDQIGSISADDGDPQRVADRLVAAANNAGGRDNITVVVVDVLLGLDPPAPDEDLEIDLGWADDEPADDDRLISAEADEPETASVGGRHFDRSSAPPPTITAPTVTSPPARRRLTVGFVLFVVALLLIAGVTALLVKGVVDKGDVVDIIPTTTTEVTTTTVAPSTTTATSTSPESSVAGGTTSIAGP